MTKKKARAIQPYTVNAAVASLSGFDEPLKKNVLHKFFEEESYPSILDHILQAVTTYNLGLRTNPNRKRAQQEKRDRQELIECMKELHIRLSQLHIPLPLLKTVKSTYVPHKFGKPTLYESIRDLMLRVWHLKTLFDGTQIPARKVTNPGKPERDKLVESLGLIFDEFTGDMYSSHSEDNQDQSPFDAQREKNRDKKEFVAQVFRVFKL